MRYIRPQNLSNTIQLTGELCSDFTWSEAKIVAPRVPIQTNWVSLNELSSDIEIFTVTRYEKLQKAFIASRIDVNKIYLTQKLYLHSW